VRERGVQSRRVSESKEAARRPAPTSSATNTWQIIAIIALLAATAGWTTVAVIALRGPSAPAAVADATESPDPADLEEESEPPEVIPHDAPELEAVLPTTVDGVALQSKSAAGADLITEDAYGEALRAFLTSVGKAPEDLHWAQAIDEAGALDGVFNVWRVAGVPGTKVRDTLIEAWKADYPDLKVTDVTVDGQSMQSVIFDTETPPSYLYVRGEQFYDIWTGDPKIAAAGIAALPAPGGSAAPGASAAPSSSAAAPAASGSTTP
jgi:hypothetical protein